MISAMFFAMKRVSLFGTSEDKTTYDVLSEEEVERIQKTDLEVYNTGNPYFGMERIILRYRYIDLFQWRAITGKVGYEQAQVYRIHNRAMDKLDKLCA